MIKPVNGHLLIDPLKHETFIPRERDTFEEIGSIVALPDVLADSQSIYINAPELKIGDKVYFDGWLAAKFPKNEEENYWLVRWADIRAIEHVEIPE